MSSRTYTHNHGATAAGEADGRRAWLETLRRVAETANAVRGGATPDRVERAAVAGMVIRLKAPFPVRFPSAVNAAEAFLTLARGAVANAWPLSTLGFLAAGAECLEALLVADGHARAEFGRRVLGGDE